MGGGVVAQGDGHGVEGGGARRISRQQLVPDESSTDLGGAHGESSSCLRATSSTVGDRRDILPCHARHFHDCCDDTVPVRVRSCQIRYRPLAITRPPPRPTPIEGSTCHTTRSMATPHRREAQTNGATTEPG